MPLFTQSIGVYFKHVETRVSRIFLAKFNGLALGDEIDEVLIELLGCPGLSQHFCLSWQVSFHLKGLILSF